ncbi:uncharacterized protein LOC129593104 [Paramacrobiotus metropolitanus]|uniref:uncharacterized protein LOC129593104 n=1 Tax=Paramacrobiotus metropolitanus TaxID=2943436 RepID=UPI002446285E|nr:uncharacterized protein LOC129593104 [Paramacrobiotus metropolitanus]
MASNGAIQYPPQLLLNPQQGHQPGAAPQALQQPPQVMMLADSYAKANAKAFARTTQPTFDGDKTAVKGWIPQIRRICKQSSDFIKPDPDFMSRIFASLSKPVKEWYTGQRKLISRRKFLLLLCILKKRKLRDDWVPFAFDPRVFSERESWRYFRFTMPEIEDLRKRLMIPDVVITTRRERASGVEALCILLRRLVYPSRWIDLRMFFGRSESSLCGIFMWVLNHIDKTFRWLLEEWNQAWLTEEDFILYTGAVAAKGGVLRGCFGFIDGTARPISRPKFYQRQCFSGHKRHHCSKWQAILLPNGMIGSLYGGHRGSMHDSTLLTSSKVLDALQQKFATFAGPERFCLYGDSGYGRGDLVKKPFSKVEVMNDRRKKMLNKAMSRVREPVEWGFK